MNLHHCKVANEHLEDYVRAKNIDILLIQDPYVVAGVAIGILGEWPFFSSTNNNAFIFLTNKDFYSINSLCLENSVFISLKLESKTIYIGSQYSPPSSNIENDFEAWSGVFPDLDNVIIGGDFNVPLITLGYARENDRTDTLIECLAENGLVIVNDPDAPYSFVQGRRGRSFDIGVALVAFPVC